MTGTAVTANQQIMACLRHFLPEKFHVAKTTAADNYNAPIHGLPQKISHTLSPEKDMAFMVEEWSPLPTPALPGSGSKGVISAPSRLNQNERHPCWKTYYNQG
jgi:hypothetical protein